MKKKTLLAVIALSVMLTACARSTEGVTGQVTANEEAATEAVEEEAVETEEAEAADAEAEEETEAAEDADSQENEETDAEDAETEDSDETVSKGSVQGGTYTNEFLKFGCAFDDEWTIAGDEELLSLSGFVADALDNESYKAAIEKNGMVYDLYASRNGGLESVNIVLQDAGILFQAVATEEAVVEASMSQLEDALGSMGFEDLTSNAITRTFAGKEHAGLTVQGNYQGMAMYEQQVCIKVGNYLAVVTAASYNEDTTDSILDMFYEVQ
ncbi:MAG: hypothetical protein IJ833_00985 [Lachnospiraceae bacterium]|nr:hypothetical protein [Lachnospiraceae bacterium]